MMKEEKKKNKTKMGKKQRFVVLASLCITLFMGGFSLFQMNRVSDSLQQQAQLVLPMPPALDISAVKEPKENATPEMQTEHTLPSNGDVTTAAAVPMREIFEKPTEGNIVLGYSQDTLIYSKTLQDWRVHSGVDIETEGGAEVKAVADGVVKDAYYDMQMGHTIVIDHSGGIETIYQNLASTEMVKVGQELMRGQGIAAVGNTATVEMLENSHLHFAVKVDGVFADPLDFMQ